MKIITLVPVKNEAWILRFSLKNFSLFSDEILILDDGSTDESTNISSSFKKVTIIPFCEKENHVNMSHRRNILLNEGRRRGGTHFVMLDADEVFAATFVANMESDLLRMNPGQKLLLPWLFVGVRNGTFVFDTNQKTNYKDFIFCDDGISSYEEKFLSEPRTPGTLKKLIAVSFEQGAVYHLQNLAVKRNQFKQAWYRVNELLKGDRSAKRINATYDYTKNLYVRNPIPVQDTFVLENYPLIEKDADYDFYLDRIKELFRKKNVLFFEGLDIWHISELRQIFIQETGREPEPAVFPRWVLILNDFKNRVKNGKLFL